MHRLFLFSLMSFTLLAYEVGPTPDFKGNYIQTTMPIAVIDSGIDYNHPRLINNIYGDNNVQMGQDFVDNDLIPFENEKIIDYDFSDFIKGTNLDIPIINNILDIFERIAEGIVASFGSYGHGTCVADVIIQHSPDTGIIMYRWEPGQDANEQILESTKQAIKDGAKIVNMSLGSFRVLDDEKNNPITIEKMEKFEAQLSKVIKENKDVLFVIAAGNSGRDLNDPNNFAYPAKLNLENTIIVGATTKDDEVAYFSNYGDKHIDIYTFGHDVQCALIQGDTVRLSGTSFSAPKVAAKIRNFWISQSYLKAKDVKEKFLNQYAPTNISFMVKEENKDSKKTDQDLHQNKEEKKISEKPNFEYNRLIAF